MTDYQKYINALRKCAKEHENDRTFTGHIIVSDLCRDTANLLEELAQEPKTVTVKQLEEMYDKFQKKLWREHEDVRGDDMIEVGYAEQFLQELLMEFGCWDREVEK